MPGRPSEEQAAERMYRDQLISAVERADPDAASQAVLSLAASVQFASGDQLTLPGFGQPVPAIPTRGAAENAVLKALATAGGGTPAVNRLVREAYARCPDPGRLARILAQQGTEELDEVGPRLYVPVHPALATRFRSPEEVWEKLKGGPWLLEPKLDGWECQIHSGPRGVRLFARSGQPMGGKWTELIEAAKTVSAGRELIIESEVLAVDPRTAAILPATAMKSVGIQHKAVAYDLLYLDVDWTRRRCDERSTALRELLSGVTSDELTFTEQRHVEGLDTFKHVFDQWASEGYEGLVAKRPDAPYEAGSRTRNRIKIKPVGTVDAVLVGYSTERRAYLAAVWDTDISQFIPFAWVYSSVKGFDKATLAAARDAAALPDSVPVSIAGRLVDVRLAPEIVVEIEGDRIRPSSDYPCGRRQEGRGWTLHAPKMARIREDKLPIDATTVAEFLEIPPRMGFDPPRWPR